LSPDLQRSEPAAVDVVTGRRNRHSSLRLGKPTTRRRTVVVKEKLRHNGDERRFCIRMNQSNDIRLTQKSFARKAQAKPEHRFQDLWHILCREDWIKTALARTLTNSGAKTAGIDGMSKKELKTDTKQAAFIANLQSELKSGTYKPMPVRRIWIPKPGKKRKAPTRNTDNQRPGSARVVENVDRANLGK